MPLAFTDASLVIRPQLNDNIALTSPAGNNDELQMLTNQVSSLSNIAKNVGGPVNAFFFPCFCMVSCSWNS